MESLFYQLYDCYQADSKATGASSGTAMTDDKSEKWRLASEVQHKFLGTDEATNGAHSLAGSRKAKLLSILEADCLPVSQQVFPMPVIIV